MTDRALGDWQTPPHLVREIVSALQRQGVTWERVLEPTCGIGNMVAGIVDLGEPVDVIGIDIQPAHLRVARDRFASSQDARVDLRQADLFQLDLSSELPWRTEGPLLVIGNPPWVTNSELGALSSGRRPPSVKMRGFSGLDAITGASNFDVTEYITMKILADLSNQAFTLALLMKTSVARRVLARARQSLLPVARAFVYRIDAQAAFGAAVDACLLVLQIDPSAPVDEFPPIPLYDSLQDEFPSALMGFAGKELIPDLTAYMQVSFADGSSPLTWRQGPKHDAASVMELAYEGGVLRNRQGEVVDVESPYLYPLVKGTMLHRGCVRNLATRLIVTQRNLSDSAEHLRTDAPRLWDYLQRNKSVFDRRRSRIYRDRPPFSMFGIGDYAFSKYKVAVSGFHKTPRFAFVPPTDGRPVMFDDTCYYTPCKSPSEAAILTALLNSDSAAALLRTLIFTDAKRPVTKRLLQRIDVCALAEQVDRAETLEAAASVLAHAGLEHVELDSADLDRLAAPQGQLPFGALA